MDHQTLIDGQGSAETGSACAGITRMTRQEKISWVLADGRWHGTWKVFSPCFGVLGGRGLTWGFPDDDGAPEMFAVHFAHPDLPDLYEAIISQQTRRD
jgi:hypothetical protein